MPVLVEQPPPDSPPSSSAASEASESCIEDLRDHLPLPRRRKMTPHRSIPHHSSNSDARDRFGIIKLDVYSTFLTSPRRLITPPPESINMLFPSRPMPPTKQRYSPYRRPSVTSAVDAILDPLNGLTPRERTSARPGKPISELVLADMTDMEIDQILDRVYNEFVDTENKPKAIWPKGKFIFYFILFIFIL